MAKQTEYAIMVEPLSAADGGGWLATVPALPGCMGDGETREGALVDVQDAIAMYPAPPPSANGASACPAACMRS